MCCLSFPRYKSDPVVASISHSRDARARSAFTKMTGQKNGTILESVTFQFHGTSVLLPRHVSLEIAKRMAGTVGRELRMVETNGERK